MKKFLRLRANKLDKNILLKIEGKYKYVENKFSVILD